VQDFGTPVPSVPQAHLQKQGCVPPPLRGPRAGQGHSLRGRRRAPRRLAAAPASVQPEHAGFAVFKQTV